MSDSHAPNPRIDNHVPAIEPLPYHRMIRDYLKREEAEVWEWFVSHTVRGDQAESVRFELLKSTYRVDRKTQLDLYDTAEQVAAMLGLEIPITVYQAQDPQGVNASLAYIPNEAHIVLHGPVASKLTDEELQALLGHELSHLLLWQGWDGEYLIVDQVLAAMTHDAAAQTAHFASARLFDLYSEIFCDRGALSVVNDPLAVVSMLCKVQLGIEEVNAKSYIRQAEEIFAKANPRADQLTHPEAFIRTRSIRLWTDERTGADQKIARMIEGEPSLDELDLLGQEKVAQMTRRLIDAILTPEWMQTKLALAHARLFFDEYSPPGDGAENGAKNVKSLSRNPKTPTPLTLIDSRAFPDDGGGGFGIGTEQKGVETGAEIGLSNDGVDIADESLRDYWCYVLLDFVTVDLDLEEYPLAAALMLGERLGIKGRLMEIARKELRLRKRQIEKIDEEKDKLLVKASQLTTAS